MTTTHRFEQRAGLDVQTWPAFDGFDLQAVVTTRDGGVSQGPYDSLNLGLHVGDEPDAVIENRRRAGAAVGLGLDQLVFCRQSHDRAVAVVTRADAGRGTLDEASALADTDALVTVETDLGLVVMVADCVPIVLYCPTGRVLSTVHAGWRGTTRQVVIAAVEEMERLGADRRSIVAGLGPAIPAVRYQVGEDVLEAAQESFGAAANAVIAPDGRGKWRFDLWAANRHLLRSAGLLDAHVKVADEPSDGERFFSDRAARPCGRFAAIARLTSPA